MSIGPSAKTSVIETDTPVASGSWKAGKSSPILVTPDRSANLVFASTTRSLSVWSTVLGASSSEEGFITSSFCAKAVVLVAMDSVRYFLMTFPRLHLSFVFPVWLYIFLFETRDLRSTPASLSRRYRYQYHCIANWSDSGVLHSTTWLDRPQPIRLSLLYKSSFPVADSLIMLSQFEHAL